MELKKNAIVTFLAAVALTAPSIFISCEKNGEQKDDQPQRELTIPEKVEADILDIISRPWQALADTLEYFRANILSRGKLEGYGPDSVYYQLEIKAGSPAEAIFRISGGTYLYATGYTSPPSVGVVACNTTIWLGTAGSDSLDLCIDELELVSPFGFFISPEGKKASLIYDDSRVGYITMEEYENLDYSTGNSYTIHYYNDTRTFTFYENGLSDLILLLEENQ